MILPGITEWLIILAVIVLMFGGKKIPSLMKGLGKGIREFKIAKREISDAIEDGVKEADRGAKLLLKDPVLNETRFHQGRD